MLQRSYTVEEGVFSVGSSMSVFYRDFRPLTDNTDKVPIVYLPGLMRTARDFDRVASHFADERRVVTVDTRGRGRGGRSDDPANYDFDQMIGDVWALTDHLGVERMVLVGLALGAFMSWRMASRRPDRVIGVVVNDTGTETVNRVGKKMVALADQGEYSFDEALDKLREPNRKNFPDFGLEDWRAYTLQVYAETTPGKWKRDFHPAILEAWAGTKERWPSLWDEYSTIKEVPVLILRGENSEFLTLEQADKMAGALPRAKTVSVQGRGHPLLLDEPASLTAIREVLAQADIKL
ncbi:alpha/beta hydrolase [Mesorhizobium sp. WSM4887]|uniref:alpha/beta fold hydrolase n=1 Tax=Mesorhizobium sp. WSM4887 TaxID=3038543 RepID=UPI002415B149|nr:alpha/beta hydrolase [Mesorhizobium sp. WSM4887]MDG4886827.1 alpha/beta hydrolase [Mesorhizobium sp. WSM4887]